MRPNLPVSGKLSSTPTSTRTTPSTSTSTRTAPTIPTSYQTTPPPTSYQTTPPPTSYQTTPPPTSYQTTPPIQTSNQTTPPIPTSNQTTPPMPTSNQTTPPMPTSTQTTPSSPSLSEASSFSDLGSSPSDTGPSDPLPPPTAPAPAPPKVPLSLTNFNGSDFAATEAIKWLLQIIGRDVVSFRRNTHVSYLVVERARDIVNTINDYIDRVEKSPTGDWDSFEKFSTAIEPLEDILFRLLLFTEDEKTRYFDKDRTIEDCVISTEAWATNRKHLSDTLKTFDTETPLVELFDRHDAKSGERERVDALTYDDQSLMGEITSARKKIFDDKRIRFPRYVKSAVAPLDTLHSEVTSGSLPEWLRVITIKSCMLVQGVLEVILQPGTDRESLNHLKSKPVWTAVTELTHALINVDKRLPDVPADVQSKYDEFLRILKELIKPSSGLPDSYVDILKEAGRIRRPFQAQAFALVMLCRFLADYFTNIENNTSITVDKVNSLEDAFNETLAVLKAAAKAVTQLRHFDLNDFENNDTVQQFEKVESVIKESFTSFGLSKEWAERENVRREAWEKDKGRMDQLNDRLAKSPNSSAPIVKVNISIVDKSGFVLHNVSVSEEGTSRLHALRWTAASAFPDADDVKHARTTGTFCNSKNESVALQTTIADFANGSDEVALKLVLA